MSAMWSIAFFVLGIFSSAITGSSKCKVELGLVVDTTRSIGLDNVPKLKASLKELVQKLDISTHGSHVALETFDKESRLHNNFNDGEYYNQADVLRLIDESIDKLSKPTRLDKALTLANEQMFVHKNGERPGVRSVMVIFTDGKSHFKQTVVEDYLNAIESLKCKGVRIVAVGIGKFAKRSKFRSVLRAIAGDNVFFADDYDVLEGSAVDDILTIICPPAACENSRGLDAAFVVDRTQSIGKNNFQLLRGFLLQVVDALNIGPNATHVGLILFAEQAQVLSKFGNSSFYSNEAVHMLIEGIPSKLKFLTRIDEALAAADEQLFTEEGGDRPEFPNVLILLTDGRTNPASREFNEIVPLLKEKKVRIVAIGIGKEIKEKELEEIAGNNTIRVDDFDQLPDFFSQILNETCSADGGFSRWSFWSDCSVSCGDGQETRTRTCTHPPPQGYGKDCVGNSEETRQCNKGPCIERDPELHAGNHGFTGSKRRKLPELKKKSGNPEPYRSRFAELKRKGSRLPNKEKFEQV